MTSYLSFICTIQLRGFAIRRAHILGMRMDRGIIEDTEIPLNADEVKPKK